MAKCRKGLQLTAGQASQILQGYRVVREVQPMRRLISKAVAGLIWLTPREQFGSPVFEISFQYNVLRQWYTSCIDSIH